MRLALSKSVLPKPFVPMTMNLSSRSTLRKLSISGVRWSSASSKSAATRMSSASTVHARIEPPTSGSRILDLRRQHLAHEVRVEKPVVVERLRELALLLELRFGEPEHADGEIVEHHLEAQLGHQLLHERRIEVLEEVGDVLGRALAVAVDDLGRIDQRAQKGLGRPGILLDPALVHIDVDALLENPLLVLEHLRVLHGGEPARDPRLPHRVGVDVAALERGHHLGRLDIDDGVVGAVELESVEHGEPEHLAAGAARHPHLLALELIEIVDVASDETDPTHEPGGLRDDDDVRIEIVVADAGDLRAERRLDLA